MSEYRTYFYARVSSKNQNLNRQIKLFEDLGGKIGETIIVDKISGKNFERAGYNYLKQLLRKGDTLVIKELDRLGRNKSLIKDELEEFNRKGIRVKIIDIPSTMVELSKDLEWINELMFNLVIEVLASFAEQERKMTNKRREEGIKLMPTINGKKVSSKTGRPIGRPPASYPEEWEKYYQLWKNEKITGIKCMEILKLKRCTFYNMIKKYEKKENVNNE